MSGILHRLKAGFIVRGGLCAILKPQQRSGLHLRLHMSKASVFGEASGKDYAALAVLEEPSFRSPAAVILRSFIDLR